MQRLCHGKHKGIRTHHHSSTRCLVQGSFCFPAHPDRVFPLLTHQKAPRVVGPRAGPLPLPRSAHKPGSLSQWSTWSMNKHTCGGTRCVPRTRHLQGHTARQLPSLWAHRIRPSLQFLSQQTSHAQGITRLSEPAGSTTTLASTMGQTLSPCPLPNSTTLPQKVLTKCLVWVPQPCPGWGQHKDAPGAWQPKAGPGKPQEEAHFARCGDVARWQLFLAARTQKSPTAAP